MKTIKLITLCLCLFLGGFWAFAQSLNVSQKLADIDRQIEEYRSKIPDAKSTAEVNKYISKIDSLNEVYEKILTNDFSKSLGTIDSKQGYIQEVTPKVTTKQQDFHQAYDPVFELSPQEKKYKADIQKLSQQNNELKRTIDGCEAKMNEIEATLKENVYNKTGIRPKNIDLKKYPTIPENDFSEFVGEEVQKYKHRTLSLKDKNEVQGMFNFAQNLYLKQEAKRDSVKQIYDKNQNDIEEFCKLCQGKCGCQ